jgi:hypothetical protein
MSPITESISQSAEDATKVSTAKVATPSSATLSMPSNKTKLQQAVEFQHKLLEIRQLIHKMQSLTIPSTSERNVESVSKMMHKKAISSVKTNSSQTQLKGGETSFKLHIDENPADFYRSRQYLARTQLLKTYEPGQRRREFNLLLDRAHRRI